MKCRIWRILHLESKVTVVVGSSVAVGVFCRTARDRGCRRLPGADPHLANGFALAARYKILTCLCQGCGEGRVLTRGTSESRASRRREEERFNSSLLAEDKEGKASGNPGKGHEPEFVLE